ncbi:hypothetical protein F4X10_19045 [Candidatus Poribacteria bacterium]|nr:hypothetical protein [Candidatus Poribacteria bacterium]
MNFQHPRPSFFYRFKPIVSLSDRAMLVMIVMLFCCYGCGVTQNTDNMALGELNELLELDTFTRKSRPSAVKGPFTLDSLIRQLGDTPQVHTYYTVTKKIIDGEPLTLDEVVAFLAADFYLFPSESKAKGLKSLEAMVKHYEAEGHESIPYVIKSGDHSVVGHPDGSQEVDVD